MSPLTITISSPSVTLSDAASAGLTVDDEGDLDMGSYDVGDGVTLTAEFTNSAGAAADPTAVVATLLTPDGEVEELATANPEVGTYTASVTIAQEGRHRYRFEGTGALVAAEEGTFFVKKRRVPAA